VATAGVTVEASLPAYWGTGSLLAAGSIRAEDVVAVRPDIVAPPTVRVRLRPNFLTAAVWNAVQPRSGVVLTSRRCMCLTWRADSSAFGATASKCQTRGGVCKAERAGLDVEFDASGQLVGAFYELYLGWIARRAQERGLSPRLSQWRASRREPMGKYQAVAQAFGDRCRT
jgi:hypothetical protein